MRKANDAQTSQEPTRGCSATRSGEPSTARRYAAATGAHRPLPGCVRCAGMTLRHTYGSLLAAAGVDLVTIQAVMGHSALSPTGRYLHARPAADQAEVFTRAFESRPPSSAPEPAVSSAERSPAAR